MRTTEQLASTEATQHSIAVSEIPAQKLDWIEVGVDVLPHEADELVAALGNGWRMPTVAEQLSCVDRTRHNPACDPEKFPDIKPRGYWTSESVDGIEDARWVVYFDYGSVGLYHAHGTACVRACRVSQ